MDSQERETRATPNSTISALSSSNDKSRKKDAELVASGEPLEQEQVLKESKAAVTAIAAAAADDDDEEGYHTPTSERNRIPEPRTCPPAPKKRRPRPSSVLILKWRRRRRSRRLGRCPRVLLLDDTCGLELQEFFPVPKKPRSGC